MSLQPNQITSAFQSSLGRAPTPFELTSYAGKNSQDIANLKTSFSKLNTSQSINDYLTYTGQDNSTQNRDALYKQHGITPDVTGNYYASNVALLKAMKTNPSGQTTDTTPVGGTVAGATQPTTPTEPDYNTQTGLLTDAGRAKGLPEVNSKQTDPNALNGSVSGATQTQDSNKVNIDPTITTARDTANSAVADVTKQIADINNTINEALQNKKDEIARSGGVVNESQLRSEVLTANAPLLAERNSLMASRSQYVSEATNAEKAYQDAFNLAKENAVLGQGQQKIDQTASKQADLNAQNDIKNAQADTKIAISANKPINLPVTDSAGNVTGHTIVTWHNPGATIGIDSNGKIVSLAPDKNGNINPTPIGTSTVPGVSSKIALPPQTLNSDGSNSLQVYQSLVSGKDVPIKGSTVPLTQSDLYNLAVSDMMGVASSTGGRTPSGAITAVKNKEDQIMKAYGLSQLDINTARAQYANLTKTNAQLLQTASYNNLALNTANDNLTLAIQASTELDRGGAKFLNQWAQMADSNFTPAVPLSKLETYIYTFGREYAKVTSGASQSKAGLTNSASDEVAKLLNASQAPETFAGIAEAMQKDMNNVIKENNNAVQIFPDTVKKLFGWVGGGAPDGSQVQSKLPPDIQTKVTSSLTFSPDGKTAYIPRDVWSTMGANMDALLAEAKAEGFNLLVN